MFIFKKRNTIDIPKKESNKITPTETAPKKSLESSLARALALEDLLVSGNLMTKQISKVDEKKYIKILSNNKIKFSDKVNVIFTKGFHLLMSNKKLADNIQLLEIFFEWSCQYIKKKKFVLLLLEVISNK